MDVQGRLVNGKREALPMWQPEQPKSVLTGPTIGSLFLCTILVITALEGWPKRLCQTLTSTLAIMRAVGEMVMPETPLEGIEATFTEALKKHPPSS